MSIFSSILDKIFHHGQSSASAAAPAGQPATQPTPNTASPAAPQTAAPEKLRDVDVEAVLSKLASDDAFARQAADGNRARRIRRRIL